MSDAHHAEGHAGPTFRTYMMVGLILAIFTASSFLFNVMHRDWKVITAVQSFILILGVAVCKAVLVGLFFMHLKYDWGKLYFMVVPALILATMMGVVLLPDAVLAWQPFANPLEPPISTTATR